MKRYVSLFVAVAFASQWTLYPVSLRAQDPPAEQDAMTVSNEAVVESPQGGEQSQVLPEVVQRKESRGPVIKASKTKAAAAKNIPLLDKLSTQPVSLDFNQADVKDVIRLLAAKSGINMIFGEDVAGALTVHLENVPFNEAFNTILSLKGLVAQQSGQNILRILKPQTLTEERAKAATFTKVVTLNYAEASAVKSNLDAVRSAEGRRGAIEIDLRTNSLIITDTPEGLDSTERLIKELDSKPKQVLIEAKLIEVTSNDELQLGISWAGAAGTQKFDANGNYTGDSVLIGQSQTRDSISHQGASAKPSAPDTAGAQLTEIGITPQGPTAGGTGMSNALSNAAGLAVGYIKDDLFFTAQLRALMIKGKIKVLSSPKITTLNNKQASIEVVTNIPYKLVTMNGTVSSESIAFLAAGIKLQVTPTINADNRISLVVVPEVSSAGDAPAGTVPPTSTRKASTNVMVKDGETLVIGGLITEQTSDAVTKVPFLGDLPILGYLFKSKTNKKSRSELLVFLTPKIIIE